MTEMYPRRAMAGNVERHRFIVLALMDSQACSGPKREARNELKKFGVLFIHAQNFVRRAHFRIRQPHGSIFPPQSRQPAKQRNSVRAAAFASEALQQKAYNFGGNAVLEALGFFVSERPFESDHVGE
jgi:hypothetical protein